MMQGGRGEREEGAERPSANHMRGGMGGAEDDGGRSPMTDGSEGSDDLNRGFAFEGTTTQGNQGDQGSQGSQGRQGSQRRIVERERGTSLSFGSPDPRDRSVTMEAISSVSIGFD